MLSGSSLKNSSDLSADERNKIESYLAIKYGITKEGNYLASDGTVIWDATANAAYHNDITVVGQDDASALDQQKSLSVNTSSVLTIDNASSLGEGNFLAIGDNALT